VISLVSVVGVIGAAWLSWVALQQTPDTLETDAGTPESRARFMALLGLGSSAFFILAIVANAYPEWVLDACH
jgi:threonine/homoserine/homoserine lactone efflux protein